MQNSQQQYEAKARAICSIASGKLDRALCQRDRDNALGDMQEALERLKMDYNHSLELQEVHVINTRPINPALSLY